VNYSPQLIKLLAVGLLFLLSTMAGTALAQNEIPTLKNSWSFEDNPDPDYDDLSDGEREYLFGEKSPEITSLYIELGACTIAVLQGYKVYQKRYPDFMQTGSLEENFLNWKMHVSQRSGYMSCLTTSVWRKLNNWDFYEPFDDFVFCGLYSRPPVTSREIRVQKLLDELVSYTKFGFVLLALNENSEFMKLNPDVEYYFSKLEYDRRIYEQPERDLHHLEAALNDDQRAFIEQAAKNYNLQAVLDQTAPCETS